MASDFGTSRSSASCRAHRYRWSRGSRSKARWRFASRTRCGPSVSRSPRRSWSLHRRPDARVPFASGPLLAAFRARNSGESTVAQRVSIDPDKGINDLVGQLGDDSKRLLADEVRLAKLETAESVSRAGR